MKTPDESKRILVVEDEPDIAALIAYQMTREGFRVETASNGDEAVASLQRELPDLVILDRMLPGMSGDEVLRRMRKEPATRSVPVLVLTAKRELEDRIHGLEMGADDYLTKPFSPRELVLRAQAILRRALEPAPSPAGRVLQAGPVRVDVSSHQVQVGEEEVSLTPKEFRLLVSLMEADGRTRTRRQLLERAWSVDSEISDRLQTRTVDMHVRRLRGKLGEAGGWIETVRGFGYRFRKPGEDDR